MNNCNLFSKFAHLNTEIEDKNDNLSWNITDSLNLKENYLNDNNLLAENNIFVETFIPNNNFDEDDDKKFIKNKLENEKFDIYNNEKQTANEEEIKRNLKLKRNREIAKEVRKRKKEYFENLINDYNILKFKYKNILKIINKCPKCFEKYNNFSINNDKNNNNQIIYEPHNNIIKDGQRFSNKKKLLFLTAIASITIISFINILNIPLNIMNYYKFIENNKNDYLRNLNNNYYHNFSYDKSNSLLLNKLNSSNGDNEALYIHFAEYYYLTKESEKKIKQKHELKEELNKNIQIIKESEINSNHINLDFAKNCVKCVVEIDKRSIKMNGDELTFYFADRRLTKFFENNIGEGIFPQFNFEENNKNSKTFSKIFAVKCKILAYCINDLFSEKIDGL